MAIAIILLFGALLLIGVPVGAAMGIPAFVYFLIKGVCNLCSFGLMNIASIVVAYIKANNRPLHDVAAYTVTIDVSGPAEEEPRVEFN